MKKPSLEVLTGNALTERIQAIKRHQQILGYTRHYTEVEQELEASRKNWRNFWR